MATPQKPVRFAHRAMHAEFALFVDPEDREAARGASTALWERLDEMESRISSWRNTSDLGQLHRTSAGLPVVVSLDTFASLTAAKALFQRTGGAFDISLGPVIALWKAAAPQAPDPIALAAARNRTGLQHLRLDAKKMTATLAQPNMRLDLGGLAKGLALDTLAPLLDDYAVKRWLLSAGGSTLLAGGPPRQQPAGWSVGLGKNVPAGQLRHRALSASGTLFRGDHIIDPRTGHPARRPVARAWSTADRAGLADAMSTVALILDQNALKKACTHSPPCGVQLLQTDGKRSFTGDWRLAPTSS